MLGATAVRKLSAVTLLLGLAFIAVGLCDGGMPDSVGAFLPALTATPRMAANPVPRSYLEAVGMSVQFSDPYVVKNYGRKKNPKTGSTTQLAGYKVGSRAPASAVRSGTTIFEATGRTTYGGPTGLAPSGGTKSGASNAIGIVLVLLALSGFLASSGGA